LWLTLARPSNKFLAQKTDFLKAKVLLLEGKVCRPKNVAFYAQHHIAVHETRICVSHKAECGWQPVIPFKEKCPQPQFSKRPAWGAVSCLFLTTTKAAAILQESQFLTAIAAFFSAYAPLLAALTAFGITYFSIPAIIRLSLVKRLYDIPDARKVHNSRIGALGGIGIFGGMLFSFVFFTFHLPNPALNSIIAALLVLFVTGVKDDIFPMVPYKKFLGQLIAVGIVTIQGDVRLKSLYGIVDIWSLPDWLSIAMSAFFFLAIINSFNFIDGINGLAAGIGVVVTLTFAYWFFRMDETLFLILSLSLAGALLAFLPYNLVRAKIFMGDSGAMVLGFLSAVLSVYFIQVSEQFSPVIFQNIEAMAFAFAILIVPIFDTLRVVFIRVVLLKRSPFAADRNHIHHALLDAGQSHFQAAITLYITNLFFIGMALLYNLWGVPAKFQMLLHMGCALALSQIPFIIKHQKKREQQKHLA
jgi:UDP-GlcNAc:undecaprenyl-phosphate/decaprenyl-phosphate GlcNAc-1-phosphate transferase